MRSAESSLVVTANLPVLQTGSENRLTRAWDDLATRTGAWPFLRPGWVEAWCRSFGRLPLEVYTMQEDERLTAVLPVQSRKLHVPFGGGPFLRSPTNWHTPLFGMLAGSPETAGALVDAVLGDRPSLLSLSFLDPADPAIEAVREASAARGYRTLARPVLHSPYVETDGDWDRYSSRELSKKLRAEVRRCRRRLSALGALSLEVTDGSEHLEASLEEGFGVEGSGWKARRGTAIASSPQTQAFYTAVGRWAAARGSLRIGFLRLDERAVAFELWLEEDGRHLALKSGYDPAYRSLAPGMVLQHDLLARAFATRLRTYEFLGDDEPYKRRWTSLTRERVVLQAFDRSPAGRAAHLAYRRARPALKRLQRARRTNGR